MSFVSIQYSFQTDLAENSIQRHTSIRHSQHHNDHRSQIPQLRLRSFLPCCHSLLARIMSPKYPHFTLKRIVSSGKLPQSLFHEIYARMKFGFVAKVKGSGELVQIERVGRQQTELLTDVFWCDREVPLQNRRRQRMPSPAKDLKHTPRQFDSHLCRLSPFYPLWFLRTLRTTQ